MATKKSKLKKASKTTTAKPAVAAGALPQPDPAALSIGDLKNLTQILDVASSRGAFRASEMAGVGLMYNKLQAFLAKVSPPEAKKEGAPIPGAAPTTAPTTVTAPTTAPTTVTAPIAATRSIKEI